MEIIFTDDFLVYASHQLMLFTSLLFVYNASRSYQLSATMYILVCSNVNVLKVKTEELRWLLKETLPVVNSLSLELPEPANMDSP